MNVTILDYGTGNLHSLGKALQAEGAAVRIEKDLATAAHADAVVLPGVGAFGEAASQLTGGTVRLHTALLNGLPCLGICLGMQLLFESSEESPGTGLCVLGGRSRRVRASRVPQMGWNDVETMRSDPLFGGLDAMVMYYANSFVVEPSDDASVIAYTTYGEDRFPAVVRHLNLWGVQFHPEKSGLAGRQLLRNFLNAARDR
jgi:imidazole glycerol-phosphate synthase subunit HisH